MQEGVGIIYVIYYNTCMSMIVRTFRYGDGINPKSLQSSRCMPSSMKGN